MKKKIYLVGLLMLLSSHAQAYVDPGSGSLFLQMLAAVGVGAMFYLSRIKEFIRNIFTRIRKDDADTKPKKDA
ncbi:MAG: hypothetical protein VX941_06055 [Pseudomonadota bacterium]|nr:hypothetical protein [Pseudomonadota bacterium]